MTPMAFLFASLFLTVILLPFATVWMADRLGLFVPCIKTSKIIEFPHRTIHAHHRHSDAA
jgi:hypothetical protein